MVSERLKTFRKSKKLSGEEFGGLIGLSKQQVSNIENGVTKLGIDNLESLINKFPDLNIYWLINGEGEMIKGSEQTQDASKCWQLLQKEEQQHNKLKEDYAELKSIIKGNRFDVITSPDLPKGE